MYLRITDRTVIKGTAYIHTCTHASAHARTHTHTEIIILDNAVKINSPSLKPRYLYF
jgi:hypothetical protein